MRSKPLGLCILVSAKIQILNILGFMGLIWSLIFNLKNIYIYIFKNIKAVLSSYGILKKERKRKTSKKKKIRWQTTWLTWPVSHSFANV